MREKDTIRGRLEQDPDFLEQVNRYAEENPDFVGMQTAEEWEARNATKKESRPGTGWEAEKDNHNNNFTANNKNKQGKKEKKPSKPPLTLEKFIEILAEKGISVRLNELDPLSRTNLILEQLFLDTSFLWNQCSVQG